MSMRPGPIVVQLLLDGAGQVQASGASEVAAPDDDIGQPRYDADGGFAAKNSGGLLPSLSIVAATP